MLRYTTIPVTAFQQNSSLLWCDETLQAAVIDPGGDLERLWPMGDATVFIPGHGPQSSFGRARLGNPYVAGT